MWRKEKGRREKGKKKKRGSTCFNFSLQWNEGHGRRGRWVSEWEWSIIYLSSIFLTLIPAIFFSLHFPLSTPLSCCFWLLVGVLQRQINRGDCLFLPVGNNSALLTLYYLALGYLNPLIYYKEHSVMISSTLDMSVWHRGSVRGEEPPPYLKTHQTHT